MNLRHRIKALLIAAFAAFAAVAGSPSALAASRAPWSAVVTYVIDGDTVQVRQPEGGKPVSIRIDGIDAPEICQTGGTAARDALKRKVLGNRVVVYSKAHDDYGRLVARIVLKGEDQGQWMVAQGMAWSYRYRYNEGPYAAHQRMAQNAGIGLFSPAFASAPAYPASFRKRHGSCYF